MLPGSTGMNCDVAVSWVLSQEESGKVGEKTKLTKPKNLAFLTHGFVLKHIPNQEAISINKARLGIFPRSLLW